MTAPWYADAECRLSQADPSLFDLHVDTFDDERETPTDQAARHAHAMRVCGPCPVADECLADARTYDDVGVRGGIVLVGKSGQSEATRRQRSRAATNRALRTLETLRAPRVSCRPLSLSGGKLSGVTPHSEAPTGLPSDGASNQPTRASERTS